MTIKILYLSKGESASSTRYRALQYFPLYLEAGYKPTHTTISGGLFPFLLALYYASRSDIVILLRKTFPPPIFWLLRKVSKKLIFELDDAIFTNTDGSYSNTRMFRFTSTIKQCDQVLAGNQYLAEIASKFQPNTILIPTSLDTKKYAKSRAKKTDSFVLVWIGSQSTKKYITGILPAIEAAANKIPNLQLKIIADFELYSDSVDIKNIPWSESTEANEVVSAHIGLAPLPADNWTKGKCALKVLQYMAAGLPTISSPTSANWHVLDKGRSGFFANSHAEWATQIIAAYHAKESLSQMGKMDKKRAVNEFDMQVIFQTIVNTLSH